MTSHWTVTITTGTGSEVILSGNDVTLELD
jgi:hypothetical protein